MSGDIAKHSSARSKLVKTLFFTLCVIAFGAMYWSWQYSDSHPSTEDAYVRAKILSVAPQVKAKWFLWMSKTSNLLTKVTYC